MLVGLIDEDDGTCQAQEEKLEGKKVRRELEQVKSEKKELEAQLEEVW